MGCSEATVLSEASRSIDGSGAASAADAELVSREVVSRELVSREVVSRTELRRNALEELSRLQPALGEPGLRGSRRLRRRRLHRLHTRPDNALRVHTCVLHNQLAPAAVVDVIKGLEAEL